MMVATFLPMSPISYKHFFAETIEGRQFHQTPTTQEEEEEEDIDYITNQSTLWNNSRRPINHHDDNNDDSNNNNHSSNNDDNNNRNNNRNNNHDNTNNHHHHHHQNDTSDYPQAATSYTMRQRNSMIRRPWLHVSTRNPTRRIFGDVSNTCQSFM
jgi:hypothetical protein